FEVVADSHVGAGFVSDLLVDKGEPGRCPADGAYGVFNLSVGPADAGTTGLRAADPGPLQGEPDAQLAQLKAYLQVKLGLVPGFRTAGVTRLAGCPEDRVVPKTRGDAQAGDRRVPLVVTVGAGHVLPPQGEN